MSEKPRLLQRLVRLFRWSEEWRVKDQQGHIWRGLRWGFPRSAIRIQILGRDGVTWYDNEALPAGIITFVEPNTKFSRAADGSGSEAATPPALAETPCSAVSEGGRS